MCVCVYNCKYAEVLKSRFNNIKSVFHSNVMNFLHRMKTPAVVIVLFAVLGQTSGLHGEKIHEGIFHHQFQFS